MTIKTLRKMRDFGLPFDASADYVRLIIDRHLTTTAAGDQVWYSYVELIVDYGDWSFRRRLLNGEHWEPALQAVVDDATDLYQLDDDDVIDLRD